MLPRVNRVVLPWTVTIHSVVHAVCMYTHTVLSLKTQKPPPTTRQLSLQGAYPERNKLVSNA